MSAEPGPRGSLCTQLQGSSPPLTALCACRFVNGAGYFAAVAEALLQAKEEIYITDWW